MAEVLLAERVLLVFGSGGLEARPDGLLGDRVAERGDGPVPDGRVANVVAVVGPVKESAALLEFLVNDAATVLDFLPVVDRGGIAGGGDDVKLGGWAGHHGGEERGLAGVVDVEAGLVDDCEVEGAAVAGARGIRERVDAGAVPKDHGFGAVRPVNAAKRGPDA